MIAKTRVQLSALINRALELNLVPRTLLSGLIKFTVRLEIEVYINKVGTSKKLRMID